MSAWIRVSTKSDDWTSGFYPGSLWYAYELSKDPRFERWARQRTSSIEREKINSDTHDLGYKFMRTFGNGLLFANDIANQSYNEVLISAAGTLAKRFDPRVACLS